MYLVCSCLVVVRNRCLLVYGTCFMGFALLFDWWVVLQLGVACWLLCVVVLGLLVWVGLEMLCRWHLGVHAHFIHIERGPTYLRVLLKLVPLLVSGCLGYALVALFSWDVFALFLVLAAAGVWGNLCLVVLSPFIAMGYSLFRGVSGGRGFSCKAVSGGGFIDSSGKDISGVLQGIFVQLKSGMPGCAVEGQGFQRVSFASFMDLV